MSFFSAFRSKVRYDPDTDPSIQERRAIRAEMEEIKQRFETERNPATGMTLADMAANRKRSWERHSSTLLTS